MIRVWILYEDQRDDQARPFGLHSILLACVADVRRCEIGALKDRVIANPKKGRDKVRAECERNLARLTRDGSHVIAVYDSDKAHDACKPPLPRPEHFPRRVVLSHHVATPTASTRLSSHVLAVSCGCSRVRVGD